MQHDIDETLDAAMKEECCSLKPARKGCCGGACNCVCYSDYDPVMSKREYLQHLNNVLDPETGIGIVDMGLIYNINELPEGMVDVTMTLTSVTCPMGPQITAEIDESLRELSHVKNTAIEIVWEPAWNQDMMNPEVKAMLFGN